MTIENAIDGKIFEFLMVMTANVVINRVYTSAYVSALYGSISFQYSFAPDLPREITGPWGALWEKKIFSRSKLMIIKKSLKRLIELEFEF